MLKRLEIAGFKSFARKTSLDFSSSVTSIVGPNGSGKSNVAEAFRFALGEQSMKSMRGKRSEDLIWSGSHSMSRSNRASVAIVFDNRKKIFPKLEFDEVTIERAVFRDGQSEYLVNGSKVRLRDVQELLASANVGDTGHHIISQGEADRILLASPQDRRAMLEDALGLTAFEFKKQDAIRKLEKTEENVRQVEALRRELVPHVRFLSKQVEKLDRAEELRKQLAQACQEYFAIEELYIEVEKTRTAAAKSAAGERLAAAVAELGRFGSRLSGDPEGMKYSETVRQAERDVDRILEERAELSREIGRLEGALEEAKKRSVETARDPYVKVPREDFALLKNEVEKQSNLGDDADPSALRAALMSLRAAVTAFFSRFGNPNDDLMADEERAVARLENERSLLMEKDAHLAESVERAKKHLAKSREASMSYEETGREQQFRVLDLAETKAKEEAQVVREEAREKELEYLRSDLEQSRAEALQLAGSEAFSYTKLSELPKEERRTQEDRKRVLERLKIRVEEAGGTGEDVRKEHKDATEREAFLAHELDDLAKSAQGLRDLIADLDLELSKNFAEGLKSVNQSFTEFFSLMFGGGGARLMLEEASNDDEEDEENEFDDQPKKQKKAGIEVQVSLPKKRVQSLVQLSGGERALTSIALIFAMSQVNPPPFLILDETDAALDEANSRRYGDMIEALAKRSQLVVITHNRETMSRAGILYGVTMGSDGVSKLLSVKFEEAAAVAK
ncbi:MAG: chromosome segregation protein [Parcubacteria bacterium C7867-001]|nr:MAG: chromosome segregation protein [Parcubacteria bacterium C7867-001]